jgi:hypothetical protein
MENDGNYCFTSKNDNIYFFWINRFFLEISFLPELRQKSWDISGSGWWILDQRPDLERLLNSTYGFGTYSFKTNPLSKMPPNWTKGENLSFCHTNRTVSRRVVINPGSDSSKSCFLAIYLVVSTPTKRKPKQEFPCLPPVLWYGPSKSEFWKKFWSILTVEWSTLEANISGCARILFKVYILIWKVF